MYDIAIIGAGPAGITAAIYASRAGLKVALIERGLYGGQLHNTDMVENYTGISSVSGYELASEMEKQAIMLDNVDHFYAEVQSIREKDDTYDIHLETDILHSKTIVVATGVKHKTLGVYGEDIYEGKGVSYCAVCDGAFFKGKHVAVVGGGDSAAESALYLANIADKVTLIHRRDELRAEKILQDRMNDTENIEVIWETRVNSVLGKEDLSISKGLVLDLETTEGPKVGRLFPVDGLFINIGIDPVTEMIKQFKPYMLNEEGYIHTNDHMETLHQGIYAIGDVRAGSIRQVVNATGDGATVVENIIKYLRRAEQKAPEVQTDNIEGLSIGSGDYPNPILEIMPDNTVVFYSKGSETLRLAGDGNIFVEERLIKNDMEITDGLFKFLTSLNN